MGSRDIHFVRVSIMVEGGDSNNQWTLKWTRLLCHSLSASLNLRSGFMQIGLLLKRLLWICFPEKIVSGCKEWPECDWWIYVFKLEKLVRHVYPYYYDKFDDHILHISKVSFVILLLKCAHRLPRCHLSCQKLPKVFWVCCQKWLSVESEKTGTCLTWVWPLISTMSLNCDSMGCRWQGFELMKDSFGTGLAWGMMTV